MTAVARSAQVSGLQPGTTYHFRMVASDAGGTTYGPDMTFTTPAAPAATPPTVTTGAASSIGAASAGHAGSATLSGTIDPNGSNVTDAHFEIGTSTAYGTSVPMPSLPGSGSVAVAGSASVGGLNCGTTYHYRLVATNAGGTTYGPDQTFQVPILGPPGCDCTWCSYTTLQKVNAVVWLRLLVRMPALPNDPSWTNPTTCANWIMQAATEFNNDINALALNPPPGSPSWMAGASHTDRVVGFVFFRFLQRWSGGYDGSASWNAWRTWANSSPATLGTNGFAGSAEFVNGVNSEATQYC